MTDVQLYLAVGLPTIAVLASLVSLVQISAIRDEIREIRTDIREIRTSVNLLTGKVIELMEKSR